MTDAGLDKHAEGAAADKWSDITSKNVLPGVDLELRFLPAKSSHINLRFDYAWGKESSAWRVGHGKAF